MSTLSLHNFTVLVVDQDDSHRWIVNNALEALGVGEVITTNSGKEAVQLLRRVTPQSPRHRLNAIDFVLCDLMMDPMDGMTLLRWIRTGKDSPNPFLPVLLMSANLEPVDIKEARGFGATQFLTKPISAEMLADRLMTIINNPRPYVYATTYFGPDRRGAKPATVDADRRAMTAADVRVIRSTLDNTLEHFPRDGLVRYFRPPNHLKIKGSGADEKDPVLLTKGAVALAKTEIEKGAENFVESSMDFIESISRILLAAKAADDPTEHFERIQTLARQLEIQGTTFGYPLLTRISQSLIKFTTAGATDPVTGMQLAKAHVDSLTVVLRSRIAGDGGDVGRELVAQLGAAIKKLTAGK